MSKNYGYEFEILEPNSNDFTTEDLERLYDGNEIRTSCCHEVVPYECSVSRCEDPLTDRYWQMLDSGETMDDPPACDLYRENCIIFHTDCPQRRSVHEFATERINTIATMMQRGKIDQEDAAPIIARLKSKHEGACVTGLFCSC